MEGRENMKAIVVKETGGADKLLFEEVEGPTPGKGELLVEVESAGVNFIDTYHREGLYPLDLPFTPGLEGAGTVTAVGDAVDNFDVGDRVAWVSALGSYAERHVVPAADAIPVPDEVEGDLAAAVLLQGITAHYLANSTFPLSEGDRCLVHAGAGGVGSLLTQIAKKMDAYVITTVGTEEKAELSRTAGADDVIVYTEVGFKEEIENRYGPNSLDVVFDGVGAATFDDSIDLLRPRGMMVTFGNASGPVPEIQPLLLAQKGSIFLTRPTMAHYTRTREELMGRVGDLFDWIADGTLEVRVGQEYQLEDAAEAHRALESRKTTGKVLLRP
jgi:NADPH:quinone reductase